MTNATHEFIKLCNAIDKEIAILSSKSADHYSTSPDSVNWAHVGQLKDVLTKLQAANAYAEMEA